MVLAVALALLLGRYPRPGLLNPRLLVDDPIAAAVFWQARLPRVVLAAIGGAALAVAGSTMQRLFANPLVEPGLIGVSQGAALGAVIALLAGAPAFMVQGSATLLALLGLAAAQWVARRLRFGGWILRVLLAGLAVSALANAAVAFIVLRADPVNQLPDITFWLLGSLAGTTWREALLVAVIVVPTVAWIVVRSWRLNLLALTDRSAFSLGANPRTERRSMLAAAALLTSVVTASLGIIGWVGLAVPHMVRAYSGHEAARELPRSVFAGALFLVVCDTLARSLLPGELPLGAFTAALGSVAFLWLLTRSAA